MPNPPASALLQCPWCGEKPTERRKAVKKSTPPANKVVLRCGTIGCPNRNHEFEYLAWNRRSLAVGAEGLREQVEELRKKRADSFQDSYRELAAYKAALADVLGLLDQPFASRGAEAPEPHPDSVRLDWLDKQRKYEPSAWGYHDEYYVWSISGKGERTASGAMQSQTQATIREAIDAASQTPASCPDNGKAV